MQNDSSKIKKTNIHYKFAIASFTPKETDQATQELKQKFREERYESALKAERVYLKLLEYMPNNITANYRYAHMLQTNFWPYATNHKLSYVQMFHLVDSYYIKTLEAYEALTVPEKQSQYAAKYAKALFSRAKLYQDSVSDNYADVFTIYTQNPDKAVPGYTVKGMVQHIQTPHSQDLYLPVSVSMFSFRSNASQSGGIRSSTLLCSFSHSIRPLV